MECLKGCGNKKRELPLGVTDDTYSVAAFYRFFYY